MTERDNAGILSRNKDKDLENPAHQNWCDFSGDVMVDGKRYWISAWIKQSKKNANHKFFSLSFKPMKDLNAEAP